MSQLDKEKVKLEEYVFSGGEKIELQDLREIDVEDQEELELAGVDVKEEERIGTYLHLNHTKAVCRSKQEGVEILDIKDALDKYNGFARIFLESCRQR